MMALTLTTIRDPNPLLQSYISNLEEFGHSDYAIIIIGDLKTPKIGGFDKCEIWDVRKQKSWLREYPKLASIIPYNSDNRRNLGYLRAVEMGTELIINVDDDNYALPGEDFYGFHSIVGSYQKLESLHSSNNWFNPCQLLNFDAQISGDLPSKHFIGDENPVYQRGFPYSKRWRDHYQSSVDEGKVVLNMGLWLGNPDVNAITNLDRKLTSIGCKEKNSIMVPPKTMVPINTQNTSFHRSILPCFYYVLMDPDICGRYGDVWLGYFAKKVIDKVGDRMTVGRPLTLHHRNWHDLLHDLRWEIGGMIITEKLIEILEDAELSSRNYSDGYLELAETLEKNRHKLGDLRIQNYFLKIVEAMRVWVGACNKVM